MATPIVPPGNQANAGFFANALASRVNLIPGAAALTSYANKSLGAGSAQSYNSRVKTSQQNGAGPAMPPINAPWSITQFGTGKRVLSAAIQKRFKK